MDEIIVRIVSTHSDISIPQHMSAGAAGMDLGAALEEPVSISPGQVKLIGTGIRIAIPDGFEGQVRPRSGLANRYSIGILNSPGTIDSDYRGEIGVLLINFGDTPYVVTQGERIAQLVIAAVPKVKIEVTDSLDETDRGSRGFGHTGR
ncbi:MAG: dUTP diphosphatase [Gemmatimonadota bacterium]|nr:dUTP diphosphatase [Gemmatimonadota bacterium]